VKHYVKSNKSDVVDAAAIAEAVNRPTMRFVEIKTAAQTELQVFHRIRDRMVTSRTRLICQIRRLCMEFGVAIYQGAGKFKADMPRALTSEENDLTPMMRRLRATYGHHRRFIGAVKRPPTRRPPHGLGSYLFTPSTATTLYVAKPSPIFLIASYSGE
jgi:transposase